MAAAPELSVVMPTHNVGPWVVDSLRSVLFGQDQIDLELIVVDDHSSDETWEIIGDHAKSDPRVRAIRSPGVGSSAARNAAVAAARGRYLAFADSDDIVARGAYSVLISSLESSGSDLALGNFERFQDDVATTVGPTMPLRCAEHITLEQNPELINRVPLWDAVYRRDTWQRMGIEARPAIRGNDIVPKTTFLLQASGIDTVSSTVYYYRYSDTANTMTRRAATVGGMRSNFSEHLERARLIRALGSDRILAAAARDFLFRDGIAQLEIMAAEGSPSRAERAELRSLARSALAAYGVSLGQHAVSREGLRNIDRLAEWHVGTHLPWPSGLVPARIHPSARRAVKRVLRALGSGR